MNIRKKNQKRRNSDIKTPKATNKPDISFFIQQINHKNSIQSKNKRGIKIIRNHFNQRVENSPLKLPLERAIHNAVLFNDIRSQRATFGQIQRSVKKQQKGLSLNKMKGRFSNRQTGKVRMHRQTNKFIDKYFNGYGQQIPKQQFIDNVLIQYDSLWGNYNVQEDIRNKIQQIFGFRNIKITQLMKQTQEDGMIGLILRIFKQIKDDQNNEYMNEQMRNGRDSQHIINLKNIIQQFMQSMYQCIQNQIYNKFNIQMRRMVVKYRQSERILKRINQKLTTYADIFDIQRKFINRQKIHKQQINKITKQKQKLQILLDKQTNKNNIYQKQNHILKQQNSKLKHKLDHLQHIILAKALQLDKFDKYDKVDKFSITKSNSNTNSQIDCQHVQHIKPFVLTIDNFDKKQISLSNKENIIDSGNLNIFSYCNQKI